MEIKQTKDHKKEMKKSLPLIKILIKKEHHRVRKGQRRGLPDQKYLRNQERAEKNLLEDLQNHRRRQPLLKIINLQNLKNEILTEN